MISNKIQTNTTHKLHTFVSCFVLHASVILIDYHQIEKYGYRRKSFTAEVSTINLLKSEMPKMKLELVLYTLLLLQRKGTCNWR